MINTDYLRRMLPSATAGKDIMLITILKIADRFILSKNFKVKPTPSAIHHLQNLSETSYFMKQIYCQLVTPINYMSKCRNTSPELAQLKSREIKLQFGISFFLRLLLLTQASFLFISCQPTAVDAPLKSYYFPLEQMAKGRIYTYVCDPKDSLDDQIFTLKSEKKDGKIFLDGRISRSDGVLTHQWQEEETRTGMVMTEYAMLLSKDKPEKCRIVYDDIFPFKADSGGIFLFDMKWKDPSNPGASYQLIRNRIFIGDTTMQVMGKEVRCIHFKVRERLEVDQDGILGLDMNGEEYYGEGIGLVRFVRQINDRKPAFTLAAIKEN